MERGNLIKNNEDLKGQAVWRSLINTEDDEEFSLHATEEDATENAKQWMIKIAIMAGKFDLAKKIQTEGIDATAREFYQQINWVVDVSEWPIL